MKITPEIKKELAQWLDTFWKTYMKGDLDLWSTFIKEDYYNIGGTKEEIWHSRQEILDYSYSIFDQFVGQAEFRNRKIEVVPYGDYLMVNEFTDLYVKIDKKWTLYGPFRMSSLLEKTDEGWIALHQHGSYPDMKATEGEAFAADAMKAENEKLQRLVEEKTADLLVKNRELEIEASSERVRTIAMGMQSPEDIMKVLSTLRKEVLKFNLGNIATWIWTVDYQGFITQWDISEVIQEDNLKNFNFKFDIKKYKQINRHSTHWGNDEPYYTLQWKGKELQKLIDEVADIDPNGGKLFQEAVDGGQIETYWQASSPFSKGIVGLDFVSEPDTITSHILTKMASAFGLAYKRFEDLQKAQAQAREAQIEVALEKVRSRSLAMHKTDELKEVVLVIVEKLLDLGIILDANGITLCTYLPNSKDVQHWIASSDFSHVGKYLLPYFDHIIFSETWESKESGDSYFSKAYSAEEKNSFFQHAFEHSDYKYFPEDVKQWILQNDKHTLSFAWQKNSAILIPSNTGVMPSQDDKAILIRFSKVLEQAYVRFLDLQTAEKQALLIREERDRLEIALSELNATQDQLIQQEKLASLGQLTAGIAHEIKNPLNFVNNFSEVSVELIEETKDELSSISDKLSTQDREKVDEAFEILTDIRSNLQKINEHGSRADSIVKSMLMHSRGSNGTKEPTHLNALIKEYVNLSFHGMRAGKSPINIEIDLQLDDSIGQVNLIAEDFSRVIINLCNNAFDACAEWSRKLGEKVSTDRDQNDEPYLPKLTVRTKADNNKIIIEIEDNGSGIPDELKDKILQPFFTTKKGTNGTGLGLSITNDIIKAHGGKLGIESNSITGSKFIIIL